MHISTYVYMKHNHSGDDTNDDTKSLEQRIAACVKSDDVLRSVDGTLLSFSPMADYDETNSDKFTFRDIAAEYFTVARCLGSTELFICSEYHMDAYDEDESFLDQFDVDTSLATIVSKLFPEGKIAEIRLFPQANPEWDGSFDPWGCYGGQQFLSGEFDMGPYLVSWDK